MPFHLKGRGGAVRVGYQVAATLGAYTLSPSGPGEWQVEASVASADAFWLSQPAAQTLELAVGQQRWIWRGVALAVEGAVVRGTVQGSPDRR